MGNAGATPQPSAAAGQEGSSGGFGRGPAFGTSTAKPQNKVQLAVSVLGGVPGATAYHSSVVVNGEEFFFSDGGISSTTDLASHRNPQNPSSTPQVIDMGMSQYTGSQLRAALDRHFPQGSYDLLKKNCNSFSDCALFYLLKKRLDKKYRSLEQIGAANPNLMKMVSGGQYTPNPKAETFDLEKLIADIDPDKAWSGTGQATGGSAAQSAEAMRAARLARFGAPSGGAAPAADADAGKTSSAPCDAAPAEGKMLAPL